MCFGLNLQAKGGLNNLIFSIGFQILKIHYFQMALKTSEMWYNGIKVAFFSKNYEKSLSGWGLRPQTPICYTFELQYTSLLKHVSEFRHFRISSIGLRPLPWTSY